MGAWSQRRRSARPRTSGGSVPKAASASARAPAAPSRSEATWTRAPGTAERTRSAHCSWFTGGRRTSLKAMVESDLRASGARARRSLADTLALRAWRSDGDRLLADADPRVDVWGAAEVPGH